MFSSKNPREGNLPQWKKSIEAQRQDAELRGVLNRNVRSSAASRKPRTDLVENFHWVIMRARRQRKMTQEEMASRISEPIVAVKKAELGIVPEGEYTLINKIENLLNVKLVKEKPKTESEKKQYLSFENRPAPEMTISDLKKMQKKEIIQDLWDYSDHLREKNKEDKK